MGKKKGGVVVVFFVCLCPASHLDPPRGIFPSAAAFEVDLSWLGLFCFEPAPRHLDVYFACPRSSLPPPLPPPDALMSIKINFCAAQLGRCLRWGSHKSSCVQGWECQAFLSGLLLSSGQMSLSVVPSCPCIAPITTCKLLPLLGVQQQSS